MAPGFSSPAAVNPGPRTIGRFVAYPGCNTWSQDLPYRVPKERADSVTSHCMNGCPQLESLEEYQESLPDASFVAQEATMVPDKPAQPKAGSCKPKKEMDRFTKFHAIDRKEREAKARCNEIEALHGREKTRRLLEEVDHLKARVESQGNAIDAFYDQNETDHDFIREMVYQAENRIQRELEFRFVDQLGAQLREGCAEAEEIEKNTPADQNGLWTPERVAWIQRIFTTIDVIQKLMVKTLAWDDVSAKDLPWMKTREGRNDEGNSELEEGEVREESLPKEGKGVGPEGTEITKTAPQTEDRVVEAKGNGQCAEHKPCRRPPRKRKTCDSTGVDKPLEKRMSLRSRHL